MDRDQGTSSYINNPPARQVLPRALEAAVMRRKTGTNEMTVSTLAIRAAFDHIGYQHNLTAAALMHALTAAGARRASHSVTEGVRYVFPDAHSRMEAVRMAAKNIARFELTALDRRETGCGALRTPTAHGCVVTFD
ncbi:hypothetical protein EVC45_02430 [Paraburkholderia sp. UYCP14C]|uniref:hypothetical protein n=1 Tax=Paraburkholderia sp. UYCP14C TaxID=2511130 RepID=UPI00101F622A|nr:hypothetical protein [Paraburkholderia sp. UYCP14C]RZF31329.1 hypothetical protein EVC45_02430 [Paraburkholderia sp. UYCP14C]